MKLKYVLAGVASIVSVIVGVWVFRVNNLVMKGVFGTWNENINREIFEKSKSYNEGKAQQLAKYYVEYSSADENGREAIKSMIQTMFADYKDENLQPKLRLFLQQMRGY